MNEGMRYFNSLPTPSLRITSRFGKRNTGIAGASTNHKGIDLGGSGGETPISAVRRGIVKANFWNDVRGWVLIIRHNERYETLYQHLRDNSPLHIGDYVQAGQQIGIMGNSSKRISCGVHLHMELHDHGEPIDFERWLYDIRGVEEDMTESELRTIIRNELKAALRGGDIPSKWAETLWAQATDAKLVDGTRPTGYMTREQAVALIYRAKKED